MHKRLRLYCYLVLWGIIASPSAGGHNLCGSTSNCRGGGTPGVPCATAYVENPAVELLETITHFDQAVIANRIVCQCRGGTSVDFTWDNDTVAVNPSVECTTASGIDDDSLTGDATFDAGADLDLDITAVDGGVTDCSFQLYCE